MKLEYKDKTILITGGTGTLGKALTSYILDTTPEVKRVCVFSRDERKHALMAQEFPLEKYSQIDYIIGDVRDKERLLQVTEGVDYVIHTAAMKDVHTAEKNPTECIKTNIGGAQNVIEACLKNNVKRVVALSTDKACSPVSLYGATKLASDKLFIAANNVIKEQPNTIFSIVRYGNIMGSNGSVVPFFLKKKAIDGVLPITDPNMTRFNISLLDGVKMVLNALEKAWGGEIFVPKLPSYKIMDVANAICLDCEKPIVGIRPGEKLHEEMISASDSFYTYDMGNYYAIVPPCPVWDVENFIKTYNPKKVEKGFSYNSGDNSDWETVERLKVLIENFKNT
ncbi:UDP-N-acetylglucosamine 4,6-dehydratase (inverting) [Seonamhaeicola aphaedonensis]|uniref:UDP-N-acetylglucosamine 4,6-dehydratase (Inverting) n=1 Tax=Seonamhaeicola aphaedonensis TaxID=1461338 RepID=A0A3D9HJ07_9FLAO|nr:UDP-N-acetylglucosamine 4,6-dehydratase (inverting) [Seonamhaeicola aphaedonensis]RED48946.1 UDP-N-acetylglucosamine 4,6-dehydratase (inverting) [Seonamhaeicola aphaedonensis]